MATPFAPFANLRLLWRRPTAAVTSLREGMRPTTDLVVIEAFAEVSDPGGEQPSGGRSIGSGSIEGNITRWAAVPSGAGWLDAGSSWNWTDTGLRPTGLPRGEKLEAFLGAIDTLPATTEGERGWITIATLSGVGGIDAVVRAAAGDEFTGTFAAGR
ncbi:MAG: hypothetical protein KGO47_08655 [Cyanobacteria bacterium REEB417]|nr:hypothetical protein [Cyanobacteria bacterium REEB417]